MHFGFSRPLGRLLALGVCLTLAAPHVALAQEPPAGDEDAEARARRKYNEGSALYSAADYNGAITAFTEALAIVTAGVDSPAVRGALLLNLAKAHVKAFNVDDDLSHLRQAREIYRRFANEADSGSGYTEGDVEEARREADEIDEQLEELERKRAQDDKGKNPVVTQVQVVDNTNRIKNNRNAGIALLATGAVFVVGGSIAIGVGSTFQPEALTQVGQPPYNNDQQSFLDSETLKGSLWMGLGGVVAGLGVVGIVTGAILFTKSRKMQREADEKPSARLFPILTPTQSGIGLTGRF